MQQNILSIDASADPVIACVVSCEMGPAAPSQQTTPKTRLLERIDVAHPHEPRSYDTDGGDAQSTPRSAAGTLGTSQPFSSVVLFADIPEYTSLNLSLPLNDPKSIRKVLDLEVQDLIPFELDEFLVDHRVTGRLPSPISQEGENEAPVASPEFDVHVGLVPKDSVRRILKQCDAWGVTPVVVSPPASALAALFQIAPERFGDDAAIVRIRYGRASSDQPSKNEVLHEGALSTVISADLIIKLRGSVRVATVLTVPAGDATSFESLPLSSSFSTLMRDLTLHMLAAESRFGAPLQGIHVLGPLESAEQLHRFTNRPTYSLSASALQEVVGGFADDSPEIDERTMLAACGACFGHDRAMRPSANTLQPLANFRTREFAYRPQLTELWRGVRRLAPLIGLALLTLFAVIGGTYFLREHRIRSLQQELRTRLTEAIPGFEAEPGKEDVALDNMSFALGQQLKDMVSPAGLSPLEVLIEISRDIPPDKGIIVRSITIKGPKVTLVGSAPDYTALDALERAFKSRRKVYDRVKPSTSSGVNRRLEFNFDITLQDEHNPS